MTQVESEWLGEPFAPVETSALLQAFPADVRYLMPDYDFLLERKSDIPPKWKQLQREWFYRGLSEETEFYAQAGISAETAFRHLTCIQGSFQPKHEHKELAVAFLAWIWFTDETHW